ncbi:polysaccharide biosynthesis/export family protein [Pseudooceanicola sp. 502str34]|uniref:polysaccharide biosynthesis/export family protein n=1 Tax=Maritimibacter alkaliphilus TaxID=404236 RepID=UPI001C939ADA|nr:polysaccharide biosynthesis/export family protein [Maritimibacter alkaliphilus]MBY6090614.1 polysaccharide biosynthesis/export family protein [Maritimibacter alkaliphilus]
MSAGILRVLVVAGLSLGLASCSVPRGAALQQEITYEADKEHPRLEVVPVTRASAPALAAWPQSGWKGGYSWLSRGGGSNTNMIRPQDRIDLIIWDNSVNSLLTSSSTKAAEMRNLLVGSDGTVFMPYVGPVRVSGQSPEEARRTLQEKLNPVLQDAQVQLAFNAGQGNSIDIVSGVSSPGTYPLPNRNYTILSALSQGGGISPTLRNPVVRLQRAGQNYEISAKQLFKDASKNIVMRGGDQIIVEQDDRFFTALGAAGREELLYFDRDKITALEALSMIGGINDNRADPKGILILREFPNSVLRFDGTGPSKQQVIYTIDLTSADGLFGARNFTINPGDTVLATESPVTSIRTIFGIIGNLVGVSNSVNNFVN